LAATGGDGPDPGKPGYWQLGGDGRRRAKSWNIKLRGARRAATGQILEYQATGGYAATGGDGRRQGKSWNVRLLAARRRRAATGQILEYQATGS